MNYIKTGHVRKFVKERGYESVQDVSPGDEYTRTSGLYTSPGRDALATFMDSLL
jgi:hypothetical protein